MALRLIQFLAIMLTALALVPSGRHLAALPNKMAMAQAAYGTVNLSGRVSRMQATGIGHWGYCQSMQQISAQTRNFWVLEALCSAAVT